MQNGEINKKVKTNIVAWKNLCLLTTAAMLTQIISVSFISSPLKPVYTFKN